MKAHIVNDTAFIHVAGAEFDEIAKNVMLSEDDESWRARWLAQRFMSKVIRDPVSEYLFTRFGLSVEIASIYFIDERYVADFDRWIDRIFIDRN